eukprot:SAG31_NODE_853_length_11512_cov_42.663279_3_plen_102_part_00
MVFSIFWLCTGAWAQYSSCRQAAAYRSFPWQTRELPSRSFGGFHRRALARVSLEASQRLSTAQNIWQFKLCFVFTLDQDLTYLEPVSYSSKYNGHKIPVRN